MNTLQKTFAIVLLTYSACSVAQVLECLDSKGKKTYAKVCPENTVKEKELESPALVSPGSSNTVLPEKVRAANAAYEQRRAARQSANDAAREKSSPDPT